MKINFLGKTLKSPIIVGSGPSVYDGNSAVNLCNCGAGAVVTKTIRENPCINVTPHMRAIGDNSLVNCEGWSDISLERWVNNEIPYAKEHGATIIASVGLTCEEVAKSAPACEKAGADYIEVVSYDSSKMPEMIALVKKSVTIPVIAKISPNSNNWLSDALECVSNGADALTCFDSMGPVAAIDIEKASFKTGNESAWLSGQIIKNFTIYKLIELRKYTDIPVIGLGGIGNAEDAIEIMMAGGSICGVVSAIIRKTPQYINKLVTEIDSWLIKHNYNSYEDICGIVSKRNAETKWYINKDKCVGCKKCTKVCCYGALSYNNSINYDITKCRLCGLCMDECPLSCIDIN